MRTRTKILLALCIPLAPLGLLTFMPVAVSAATVAFLFQLILS